MAEKGTCKVELGITLNVNNSGNFVKATVSFDEDYYYYSGEEDNSTNILDMETARNDKFQELLEVVNDKLDEAVLAGVHKIKQLTRKDD